MHAIMLGVTWGLMGLNVGWRALPGGGVEYIIQIAPHELDIFKQDKSIEGDVPAHLRDIRSYRIVVGNEVLPRQDPPKPPPTRTASLDLPAGPSAKRGASGYYPFTGLTSWWEKYPFAKASPPESAKRTSDTPSAGSKTLSSDRKIDEKKPDDKTAKSQHPATKEAARPWLPFTVAVVALFGSLGGNLYLGWITWETRKRYRALLRRRKKAEHDRREESRERDIPDQ
jgi:hypothetical protein